MPCVAPWLVGLATRLPMAVFGEPPSRFARAVVRMLPRGPIGYLADWPADQLAGTPRGMEEYFITQFALVPWVIDARATDCRWVVANLHTASLATRIPTGYVVAKEFDAGVALLWRSTP